MSIIGDYLRVNRVEKKFSQKEAAEYVGLLSPQFISNIERGICDPSWEVLRKLIKLYSLHEKTVVDLLLKQRESFILMKLKSKKKRA